MQAPPPPPVNLQNPAPLGPAFFHQLPVPAPHPSPALSLRVARRYPDAWVDARLRMRRGREGIVCSFTVLDEEVGAGMPPLTPSPPPPPPPPPQLPPQDGDVAPGPDGQGQQGWLSSEERGVALIGLRR